MDKDGEKRFSGQEVFEMVWSVLDAIDQAKRDATPARLAIPNNVIAQAVRMELELDMSPVGLRVELKPDSHGGASLCWIGHTVTR